MPRNTAFHSMASVTTHDTQVLRYMEILKKIAHSSLSDARLYDALQTAALKAKEKKKEVNVVESRVNLSEETIAELKHAAVLNMKPVQKKMTEHFPVELNAKFGHNTAHVKRTDFVEIPDTNVIVPSAVHEETINSVVNFPEEAYAAVHEAEEPAVVVQVFATEEPTHEAEEPAVAVPVFATEDPTHEFAEEPAFAAEDPIYEFAEEPAVAAEEPNNEFAEEPAFAAEDKINAVVEANFIAEEPIVPYNNEETAEESIEEINTSEEATTSFETNTVTSDEFVDPVNSELTEAVIEEPVIISNVVHFESTNRSCINRLSKITRVNKRKRQDLYEGQPVSILFGENYYNAKLGKTVPAGRRIHYYSGHVEVVPEKEIYARIK